MTAFEPTGDTQVFGIFGYPVRHTLSPQMQQAAFKTHKIHAAYLPFEVHPDQLKKAVASIVPLGIKGVNITIPHKEKVIPFLDEIDPEAEKVGAVNTIKNNAGRLIGYNTDGRGYVASLREAGVDPTEKAVILLGAGGAAKGVAIALINAGVRELIIHARRAEAGAALAAHLKSVSGYAKLSAEPSDAAQDTAVKTARPVLLINTTPLGMKPGDALPFPASHIKADWVVSDLIYRPFETPLLAAAKKIGAETVPGLGMLLHQGALAFEIWTALSPPIQAMNEALLKAFSHPRSR